MVKNQKPTKAEQEKADLEKLQKRMESMLPTKADIPAAISLRQTEELKVRIRELEAQLSQQMAEAQKKSNSDVETLIPEQTEIETKQTSESKISLVTKNIATVETKNQPATPFHEKAKQLGLWAAGIFTIIGLAFFSYSAYTLFFIQQGQAAIEDRVLLPITILMFVASAISFFLIRGNRFILGIWLLVSANLIIPSILSVLVLRNIYPVVLTYLITLTALLAFLIFPRTSRWQVLTAAATTILIIIGIEIWNPAFRGVTANLTNFTFVMIVLASVGFMVFFIRQANAGSITTKLTTTFVAVAVLSMGIVTYQGNRSLSNSLTSEIIDSQAQLAASQSSQIGQAINSQYDKLKSLATVKTIQTGTESANQDEARPTDVLEIEKLSLAWRDAVKANNTADPLVIKVLYNPLSTQLRKFQKTFPENVEILLTDDKGFTIAATNLSPNYYQADTLWWRTARTSGQYIGQPILNPNTNSIALDMSIPVYSYTDGAFEGVLRTTVNFNVLTDLLVQAANGQTGYSLIYLPNDQFIKLQRTENGTYSLVQDFASTDLQNYLKSPDSNQQLSLDGKAVLAKFAPVKSYSSVLPGEAKTALDSLGWQAGVIQEKSEALQPVTTQTRNNFTLAVFIIVLVLAISYFLAGFITNPIIRLTAVANQFASGDLSAVAKVETRDEIGTLATTFNRMTSQLQDTLQNLEKRVADRTQDLELAAEVGRTITEKVENTSVMLTEAVEMIRSNFNLYYTQVYLLDPTGQTINLRAGTGDVGRELLSRGHLLFVGSTSLNGRAISEKKPIIVADTEKNESFLPNPLLPKTRSEMAIPLLLGNKVLGVLDMQSETPNALNEENVASFQVLASQLSVAIQNASLLSQSEESRKQMEENFLRTTSTNWQDFLNGTDRGEKIGYVFDQIEVKPIEPKSQPKSENILNIPISVIGAEVGSIQVSQDNREWTSSEAEIIQSTADQLAQHIENLRLLSQAEKYRQEAEQTTRRLTRESWEDFVQTRNVLSESYSFSPNEVKGKNEEIHMESSSTLSLPLNVRDEAIGELMIHTENVDRESMNEIFSAVVLQLGEHIENLRLLETTEFELGERKKAQSALDKRAEQLVTLNRVMEIANSSLDLQYILQTATDEFRALMQAFSAGVLMLDEKGETLTLTTESYSDPSMPKLAGRAMPIAANPATDKSIKSGNTVLVPNAQTDPILAPIHAIMKQRNIQSVLVTPLFSRNKIIGVFSVDTNDPERHFDDNDVTLIETLAKQLASAIESIQLFDETRRRAANLSTVAAVSTTTSTMLNPAELLQTVVDITKERFNLYHAHIYLSDISLENLLLAAGAGDIGRQMVETSHAIQINTERSLVARAAREKRTVVINNVQQEEGFLPNALLPDTIAEMAVPMVVGETLLGVFDVQSDKASGFSSEDADIYNTLASQVAIALQNARLYVEQAATVTQLRELDKLKSSFLANMSHELRTPLNSILGFTDVILEELDGPLTANMDNDLKLIQKNGKHLLHLINDVLDMAKIESGKMNLLIEKFNLNDTIEDVMSITSSLANEKSIKLFIEPESDQNVFVRADHTRLRQVLINLINNGVKFTEKGSVSVCLKHMGNDVLIAVKDTGLGIPEDHLEAVFSEFTQVDSTTTRKAGGTGLGLPISRRLIEMHGGKLWAESGNGNGIGSTFNILLPIEAVVSEAIVSEPFEKR